MFKKLWKQLRSDWVRVLMAFVLGCLIYLLRSNVFSSSVESREFSNITVNLEYPNANIINLDNKKPVAAVTLEGTPHRIQKLTPEQIIIKADVEQTHLNSGLIELTEKNIKVPFGIPYIGWYLAIAYLEDYEKDRAMDILEEMELMYPEGTAIGDKVRYLLKEN